MSPSQFVLIKAGQLHVALLLLLVFYDPFLQQLTELKADFQYQESNMRVKMNQMEKAHKEAMEQQQVGLQTLLPAATSYSPANKLLTRLYFDRNVALFSFMYLFFNTCGVVLFSKKAFNTR